MSIALAKQGVFVATPVAAGRASVAVTDEAIVHRTTFALGLNRGDFAIRQPRERRRDHAPQRATQVGAGVPLPRRPLDQRARPLRIGGDLQQEGQACAQPFAALKP